MASGPESGAPKEDPDWRHLWYGLGPLAVAVATLAIFVSPWLGLIFLAFAIVAFLLILVIFAIRGYRGLSLLNKSSKLTFGWMQYF